MTAAYRIIYPNADRSKLSVRLVNDDHWCDHDLASSERFCSETEAIERMIELAKKFCKIYENPYQNSFLDLN